MIDVQHKRATLFECQTECRSEKSIFTVLDMKLLMSFISACKLGIAPVLLSYVNKGLTVYATFTTDEIVLECEIQDGYPPATFTWYKDSGHGMQPITEDRYVRTQDDQKFRLIIKSADVEDNGNYIMKAKNQCGEALTYCEIRIFGKHHLFNFLYSVKYSGFSKNVGILQRLLSITLFSTNLFSQYFGEIHMYIIAIMDLKAHADSNTSKVQSAVLVEGVLDVL